MSERTVIELQRKMRRVFDATIQGDLGLAEGELWWMDEEELTCISPERFQVGHTYDMRVDLQDDRGVVRLKARITRAFEIRSRAGRRSFLHLARYRASGPKEQALLLRRLVEINPDVRARASDSSELSQHTSVSTRTSTPSPAPPPRRRRSRRARSGPRSRSSATPSGARTNSPPSMGSARRRVSQQLLGEKAVQAASLVRPLFSKGPPPSLFVALDDTAAARRCLRLQGTTCWCTMAQVPGLREDQDLLVVMELPDRVFVQFTARVLSCSEGQLIVEARRLEPGALAPLRLVAGKEA